MARIRTVKPEISQSQSFGRVTRDARLCFMLLITQADDQGRLRGHSRMLASLLFPYDEDAPKQIDKWLAELEREGMIRRYSVNGDDYVDLPKWEKHQRVEKASDSKHPSFTEGSQNAPGIVASGSRIKDQGSGTKDHSLGASARRDEGEFERFWKAYPKREGANPKNIARKKYWRVRDSGIDADVLEGAARAYGNSLGDKANTQFVCQTITWLNQERWYDYDATEIANRRAPPAAWVNGLASAAAKASAQLRFALWKCRPELDGDRLTLYAPTKFLMDELLGRHVADLRKLWPAVRVEMEVADAVADA